MNRVQEHKLIEQCIQTGELGKNCSNCPAHHSHGGHCCFGIKWANDEECRDCRFCDECAQDTRKYKFNSQYTPASPSNYHPKTYYSGSSPIQVSRTVPVQSQQTLAPYHPGQSLDQPLKDLLVRIGKDSVWGGVTAVIGYVHEGFRNSRWK